MMEFDHILLMGHGGPRKSEEVIPFLKLMTERNNISEARLNAIVRNYEMIGGASPYYDEVTHFAKRLERSLRDEGMDLPVFIGMKHWHPFFKDVLAGIHLKGYGNGLGIALNAFYGAAAGTRYRESLEAARTSLKVPGLRYDFLKGWHGQKLFVEAQVEEVSKILGNFSDDERLDTAIIFSFHSLPVRADRVGPEGRYSEEVFAASALVAKELGCVKWSVAYQSRPAEVKEPWLGPDIGDTVEQLAGSGEKRVVVVPLGFFCDHVEILYDLDRKTREIIEKNRMEYWRSGTVIHHPKITRLITELIAAKRRA